MSFHIDQAAEEIKQLRELNAELLSALKYTRLFLGQPTPVSAEIDELIAKAEKLRTDEEKGAALRGGRVTFPAKAERLR
jgi:hypothetical protein